MGEGGAVYIKNDKLMAEAEIIREKGTNRKQFLHGQVNKYSWYMIGSSILPSDVLAAILYGQLQRFDKILSHRLSLWNKYFDILEPLESSGLLRRPHIPSYTEHNAHIFFVLLNSETARNKLLYHLKEHDITATFHYLPLHTAPLGQKYGCKPGDLPITEDYSSRLLRLPLHYNMTNADVEKVYSIIKDFFKNDN